ncbi:MAG: hypothetical protein AAGJ10_13670 [Bacteroidota bacterium]
MGRGLLYIVLPLVALVTAPVAAQAPVDVVVITHPSTEVESIDQQMLFDFFTRDRLYWKDGQAATIFDMRERNPVKEAFYKHFLGKSPSRVKSAWLKKKLMGEGDPPEALDSAQEVIERVTHTVGAIGYVARDQVVPGVKVLTVIGSSTGEPIRTAGAR